MIFLSNQQKLSPLAYNPVLALSLRRLSGMADSQPLLKARRVNAADEVDIFDIHPTERKYKIAYDGEWQSAGSEKFYIVSWYDSTGNGNNAYQTSASYQPELIWIEKDDSALGSNILLNSGFEDYTGTQDDNISDSFSNWSVISDDADDGYVQATATAKEGSNALSIRRGSGTLPYIRQQITTIGNTWYKFSFYTKNDVITGNGGRYYIYDLDNSNYLVPLTYTYIDSSEWIKVEAFFKTASNGINTRLQFYPSGNGTDVVYFDDVKIQEITEFRPVTYFDGVDDYLDLTGLTNPAGNYTFFIALKQSDTSELSDYVFDTQTGRLILAYPYTANNIGYYDGVWSGTPLTYNDFINLSFILNNSGSSIYKDNTLLTSGLAYTQRAIGGNVAIGSNYVGANPFGGVMENFMIYNKVLPMQEIYQLNRYFE